MSALEPDNFLGFARFQVAFYDLLHIAVVAIWLNGFPDLARVRNRIIPIHPSKPRKHIVFNQHNRNFILVTPMIDNGHIRPFVVKTG